MPDADLLPAIVAFIERIGIAVHAEPIAADTLLPAMTIRNGTLIYDPARLEWPGDLLHEAGHIAVTEPALRPTLCEVPSDGGEEMAAIAWSYAAAVELRIEAAVVFHADGYRGDGNWLADTFASGSYIGLPLLVWYGMTCDPKSPGKTAIYPAMSRWLR